MQGGVIIKKLIKNGIIVNYDCMLKGDILIDNSEIIKVDKNIESNCEDIIDAKGNYIFPGLIDAHTHPGLPQDLGFKKDTDDFYTETKAAIKGGTTTIFDFAEQKNGERLLAALEKRKSRYKNSSGCKYEFHVAVTSVGKDTYEQLMEIKDAGINSIKIYTTYDMKLRHEEILTLLDYCAKLNITALIHCEEDSIIKYSSKNLSFSMTRPKEAEENMVNTVINFSRLTGCRVYICHVSSKDSMELIKRAKEDGLPIIMETCPQYLIFDDSIYNIEQKEITKYILSPPFREVSHKEPLIKACLDGTVDLISTDHCAFLFKEHKEKYYLNLENAAKGMPGIQLRSSLIYNLLVINYGLDIKDYVKLLSYNPAKIFGLKDRGYIKSGMKADLVIWSNEKFKVNMRDIIEGTDYSPYEGFELIGKPLYTNIAL